MSRMALDISGMTCAACSSRVAKALSRVEGVSDAEVNLSLERANIELVGDVNPEKLIEAVEKAGYGATLRVTDGARQRKSDDAREAARRGEERQTLDTLHPVGGAVAAVGRRHAADDDGRRPRLDRPMGSGRSRRRRHGDFGYALLSRSLQCRARRRRQHGGAGFARHVCRLLRLASAGHRRQCTWPPIFRGSRGRADSGHARQISRGAGKARRGRGPRRARPATTKRRPNL